MLGAGDSVPPRTQNQPDSLQQAYAQGQQDAEQDADGPAGSASDFSHGDPPGVSLGSYAPLDAEFPHPYSPIGEAAPFGSFGYAPLGSEPSAAQDSLGHSLALAALAGLLLSAGSPLPLSAA